MIDVFLNVPIERHSAGRFLGKIQQFLFCPQLLNGPFALRYIPHYSELINASVAIEHWGGVRLHLATLTLRSEPHFLGEAVSAALYLFSGAVFPISVLPEW